MIVPSEQAFELIARQTKIDIAIGHEAPTTLQDTVQFIQTSAPFADTAIRHLATLGHHAAYLACAHTEPGMLLSYMPGTTVTLFSKGMRYYPVRSGFAKWKPAGELVYVSDGGVDPTGLDKTGENTYLTSQNGVFTLSFSSKYVVIGETFETN